jgi:hypothetical protein
MEKQSLSQVARVRVLLVHQVIVYLEQPMAIMSLNQAALVKLQLTLKSPAHLMQMAKFHLSQIVPVRVHLGHHLMVMVKLAQAAQARA